MYNWAEMTWDDLINFQTDFPLSQQQEAARQAEISYREAADAFGDAWKAHARSGFDRPTTPPTRP